VTADGSGSNTPEAASAEAAPSATLRGLTPDVAAEDTGVTGILLIGGASSRFGSPKALAELHGERLAERAWRVLGEVCDERLAVGKRHDSLGLPFPVLDDGAEERAPIYGVLAGLRAASNEVSVVLPVDCPLVTPTALRTLADALAVPQTGPLPGAYARSHIRELERRIAQGPLSLRGVNPNVVEIDEELLANVNTPDDLRGIAAPGVGRRAD
jgi:molybdopterin-guanine dinucleotide biosynthesis protein A